MLNYGSPSTSVTWSYCTQDPSEPVTGYIPASTTCDTTTNADITTDTDASSAIDGSGSSTSSTEAGDSDSSSGAGTGLSAGQSKPMFEDVDESSSSLSKSSLQKENTPGNMPTSSTDNTDPESDGTDDNVEDGTDTTDPESDDGMDNTKDGGDEFNGDEVLMSVATVPLSGPGLVAGEEVTNNYDLASYAEQHGPLAPLAAFLLYGFVPKVG